MKSVSKRVIFAAVSVALLAVSVPVWAKSDQTDFIPDSYIIEMQDAPLVYFDGASHLQANGGSIKSMQATSPRATGSSKLDVNTAAAKAYHQYLDQQFDGLKKAIQNTTGLQVQARFRYYNIMNGFAAHMSAATAAKIRQLPGVKSVTQEKRHKLTTWAGPEWVGAKDVWNGVGNLPNTKGEGIVVGMIDSGVNMDHPSFAATGDDGFTITNPKGQFFGDCGTPQVTCNNKLIGIYDFTDEGTNGEDSGGHGSHTSSTAAGNILNNLVFSAGSGTLSYNISGVAPHANIISYKVCREDDPNTTDDEEGCAGSAILQAIDQAAADAVDVVNYSIGSSSQPNPWSQSDSLRFLALREAGIFVATSAGNDGPNPDTVGSPANAPWVTSVAAASHDGVTGTRLRGMTGGDTTPPAAMVGESLIGGLALTDIVYAGDFGNALCGQGTAQLASTCAASNGFSKPQSWNSTTFAGKIVVCDRGIYGRIEKSKNVMLAGAVGYILINTDAQGEDTVADEHCLPAAHIGAKKGKKLRNWLTSGSGHKAKLDGVALRHISDKADILASFSSRGPLSNPEDILKPNVMAPGRSILAAFNGDPNSYGTISGTSMASPHVAGAGALVKAVNPGWGPDQIASALEITATMELARDFTGEPANFHQAGAGRIQAGLAAQAGLYLPVTGQQFRAANPAQGGNPGELNLAGMTNPNCKSSCSFTRKVKDSMGGGSWSVSTEGDTGVTVTPQQFTLGNGGTQNLNITADTSSGDSLGRWNYTTIVLKNTNGNAPDAHLSLAVFGGPGNLPTNININSAKSSGSKLVSLSGLVAISDGNYEAGGLVKPTIDSSAVAEDPTPTDPFNTDGGNVVRFVNVPTGALLLRALTGDTTAQDMDLYVGIDSNGNNRADESEVVCSSLSGSSDEFCEISQPASGTWWIMMQAFSNTPAVVAKLSYGVISTGNNSLIATGQGLVAEDATSKMRLSWQNVQALKGEEYWGAVGLGTDTAHPGNMGIIPVTYKRTNESDMQKSVILGNNVDAAFVLPVGAKYKRLVFDVPAGQGSVDFKVSATNPSDNANLKFRIYRLPFSDAYNDAPFVTPLPAQATALSQGLGAGNTPPMVTISGSSLMPGRYYIKLENTGAESLAVTANASYQGGNPRIQARVGIWGDGAYGGQGSQGFDFNEAGNLWFGIWYTYNEDGTPTWYLFNAATITANDNVYTTDIIEFTNNPIATPPTQKFTVVGKVTITVVAENDIKFSYLLNGEYGASSAFPLTNHACQMLNGNPAPITGTWAPDIVAAGGIGGSSVEYGTNQGLIHYVYDQTGEPRWVIGAGPIAQDMDALEFRGYCPTCDFVTPTSITVGTISQNFSSASEGSQVLNFTLQSPNNTVFNRTLNVSRLTKAIECN